MSLEQLAAGLARLWPLFERAVDCDRRAFCIDRCKREFVRAAYFDHVLPEQFEACHGNKAAIEMVRRRVRLVETLPWLSHRFLGLDACWLTLLGFRFARESRRFCGGIEAARTVAEELLELPPGTAGRWALDDLFRVYCDSKLTGTWTDGARIYEPDVDWRPAA